MSALCDLVTSKQGSSTVPVVGPLEKVRGDPHDDKDHDLMPPATALRHAAVGLGQTGPAIPGEPQGEGGANAGNSLCK